jgi:hypothetical protein
VAVSALTVYFVYLPKNKEAVEATPSTPVAATSTVFTETNEFYDISAVTPIEPRDTNGLMKTFVDQILAARKEEWKIGGPAYMEEKKLTEQFPDRAMTQYVLDISYKTFESKLKDTKTYVFNNYESTGGAHGNSGLITYAFGPKGYMTIEDVLDFAKEGDDVTLTRLLRPKILKELARMSDVKVSEYIDTNMLDEGLGLAFLDKDGKFNTKKCNCDGFLFASNFQNFVITDEGIRFIFGQYQVAPYVFGMPEVTMSWDELSDFLK